MIINLKNDNKNINNNELFITEPSSHIYIKLPLSYNKNIKKNEESYTSPCKNIIKNYTREVTLKSLRSLRSLKRVLKQLKEAMIYGSKKPIPTNVKRIKTEILRKEATRFPKK